MLSSAATARQFDTHRDAALFLLNGGYLLTRKAGSFLGQLVVDQSELTEKQADWLDKLLAKRGLPSVTRRG
ncbi:hypothetical protein GRI36_01595 [Altererythrobacter gangjinensis]|uniref:Uncharacterized protein n=1 Tax=Pontixanthobacter gangjinensis TaxID=1028742 RepID=A0A6I4SL86_9SPHN|nr:hypothetical protein [Pontixanthobacter gangjinensis]